MVSTEQFEHAAAQIKSLQAQIDAHKKTLNLSRETALRMIAEKTAEAKAALEEAQRIAHLAGVDFSFNVGGYGATYDGSGDYWTSSSYNC